MEIPLEVRSASNWSGFGSGICEDAVRADPLLDCLVELARIHGRPTTATVLGAGLPIAQGGLTPQLFPRAAERAGLSARLLRKKLAEIDPALLPVVLLLQGDTACLLLGWSEDGSMASVLFPETGRGAVGLAREELAQRYLGYALFARPEFRFDQRTAQVRQGQRHWFWDAVRAQWPVYRDMLGAALLINVFALLLPLFSMNVYDRVVPNFAQETLWTMAVGLVLVLGIDYALRLMRGHFVDLAGTRIDVRLSAQIMERVLGMKLERRPASTGAFTNILRSFESIRDFVASATVTALVDLPFALLFLGVIAWICWPLVVAPVVGLLLVLAYSFVAQRRMNALAETTYRASAMRNATLVEAVGAMETVKAHNAEGVMQTKLEETANFLARTSAQLRLAAATVTNAVASLHQLVNIATIVAGVYLIHDGRLTTGGLVAASMLAGRAMAPLGALVGLLMQYHNARQALQSLEQTMATETERSPDTNYLHRPEIAGGIAFEGVHFHYPGREQPTLKGLSFRIQPGEKVVVIGRVGSGKTTLQRLLLGLYAPTQGSVTVDGIDIRQIDPAQLRRNVGYVDQDATLFYGTLRDNIAIAAPGADERTVLAAAELAGLGPLVNRHPQGFDMLVSERGESLSGGQRQAVAIARAALLDPPILVLDEPTASMDFTTETQFKERLARFARNKTMLVVTHRNSLLDLADRVLVIDDGRIVADGPRDQVLADLRNNRVERAA